MVPTACFARGEYFQGEGVGMVEWWNGGMHTKILLDVYRPTSHVMCHMNRMPQMHAIVFQE